MKMPRFIFYCRVWLPFVLTSSSVIVRYKMTIQAIKYQNGHLEILNQLLLPQKSVYEELFSTEDGWQAIRQMKVGRIVTTSN